MPLFSISAAWLPKGMANTANAASKFIARLVPHFAIPTPNLSQPSQLCSKAWMCLVMYLIPRRSERLNCNNRIQV